PNPSLQPQSQPNQWQQKQPNGRLKPDRHLFVTCASSASGRTPVRPDYMADTRVCPYTLAIRHSLPFLSWLIATPTSLPFDQSPVANRYSLPFSPVAIRQSLPLRQADDA
ncbi:MAG: hypothetical protein ACO2PK_02240, partial [Armatimonadota bacterium]